MWTVKLAAGTIVLACAITHDLTDQEWSVVEPLIPPAKHGGNKHAW